MKTLIKRFGGPKIVILIAIALTVIFIFGVTIVSSVDGSVEYSNNSDHGHEH